MSNNASGQIQESWSGPETMSAALLSESSASVIFQSVNGRKLDGQTRS
jgi:hypothetical protein